MTRTKLRKSLIEAERERCARIADSWARFWQRHARGWKKNINPAADVAVNRCQARVSLAEDIAREIRSGK